MARSAITEEEIVDLMSRPHDCGDLLIGNHAVGLGVGLVGEEELPYTGTIFPPMLLMPPLALISSMAMSMADLINCPDSANPPVRGRRNPTFISFVCASARDGRAAPAAPAPMAATAERRVGSRG